MRCGAWSTRSRCRVTSLGTTRRRPLFPDFLNGFLRGIRRLGEEKRTGKLQAPRRMRRPRPFLDRPHKPNGCSSLCGQRSRGSTSERSGDPIGHADRDGPWMLSPMLGWRPEVIIGALMRRVTRINLLQIAGVGGLNLEFGPDYRNQPIPL